MNKLVTRLYWRGNPNHSKLLMPLSAKVLGYRKAPMLWRHPEAKINCFNVYWNLKGGAKVNLNGQAINFHENDFFIQGPGHKVSAVVTSDFWEYYWLAIDGKNISSIIQSFKIIAGVKYSCAKIPIHIFKRFEKMLGDESLMDEMSCSVLSYELLSLISSSFQVKGRGEDNNVSKLAFELIDKNFEQSDFDVNKLSKELKLDRSILARKFKLEIGESPSEIISKKRLRKAMQLLCDEDLRLDSKEVAFLCGFEDPSYFSRFFKQRTGRTPLEFKKDYQIGH